MNVRYNKEITKEFQAVFGIAAVTILSLLCVMGYSIYAVR